MSAPSVIFSPSKGQRAFSSVVYPASIPYMVKPYVYSPLATVTAPRRPSSHEPSQHCVRAAMSSESMADWTPACPP